LVSLTTELLNNNIEEIIIKIRNDSDIISARREVRDISSKLGFSTTEQTLIATAISELARNILKYACEGELGVRVPPHTAKITISATDKGPGIKNLDLAMQDGYSSSGSLGLGLSGVKRIMDEFEIKSEVGKGTKVVASKSRMGTAEWRYK
jgi:serine/threonine-protein kinase RsbT